MVLTIVNEISFLVQFCFNFIYNAFLYFGGYTIILGFILIWIIIDNFIPKG